MMATYGKRVDFLVKSAIDVARAGNRQGACSMLKSARSVVATGRRAHELSLHEARSEREFIAAAAARISCTGRGDRRRQ